MPILIVDLFVGMLWKSLAHPYHPPEPVVVVVVVVVGWMEHCISNQIGDAVNGSLVTYLTEI